LVLSYFIEVKLRLLIRVEINKLNERRREL
jgi:hypothetical protein